MFPLLSLTSLAVKRLQDADHIIVLGSDGRISEQGSFEKLKLNGGYTTTFGFSSAESSNISSHSNQESKEIKIPNAQTQPEAELETPDLEADGARRTGDTSVYLYYVQAIGWIPTVIFFVCISCYVFGISFPSKFKLRES